MKKYFFYFVTPRMRRVSRNIPIICPSFLIPEVTPRMRRVSRNGKDMSMSNNDTVTPRMRRVSRNGKRPKKVIMAIMSRLA